MKTAETLPTIDQVEFAAIRAHEMRYILRGERYATAQEMGMHRGDPLADYELVRSDLIVAIGVVVEHRGCIRWAEPSEIVRALKDIRADEIADTANFDHADALDRPDVHFGHRDDMAAEFGADESVSGTYLVTPVGAVDHPTEGFEDLGTAAARALVLAARWGTEVHRLHGEV